MEAWQMFALIPIFIVSVMLICLASTAISNHSRSAPERKAKKKLKENPHLLKSEAFCQGFRDMAKGFAYTARGYIDLEVSYDLFNNPSLPDYTIDRIGQEALNMKEGFDLELGQTSEEYLGGTDREFQDYYLGGLHFVSVMDEAKTKALDARHARTRQKKIIEARKKGLRDVNAKIATDIRELDALRVKTFSTEEFENNWERQMKEITNGVL